VRLQLELPERLTLGNNSMILKRNLDNMKKKGDSLLVLLEA